MPIKIQFLSETSKLERGGEEVEKALDDVADSLDDVARDGDRSLGRLERSFRELADGAKDTTRETGRMRVDGARDLEELGRTGEEIGGELRQNLGETFSSFRGDLADLPQIAQDTLGGLAGSGALGGIPGLAATAAGAAGLGLIIGAIENIDAATQASRERVNGWAQAYTEAGGKVLDASIVQQRMSDILTDTGGKLKEAQTNAKLWGVSVEDAVLAMAGHAPTLAEITAELDAQAQAYADATAGGATLTGQKLEEFQALQQGREIVRGLNSEMAEGASVVDIMSAANYNLLNSAKEASKEVDELGNAVYTLPDGTQIFIDAETGIATQNVEKFKGDLDGVAEMVVRPTIRPRVDDTEWRNWQPSPKTGRVAPAVQGSRMTWE